MKKITLLLIALFSTLGIWATTVYAVGSQVTSAAGIVDGGTYVIRVNSGSYITEDGSQYAAPSSQNSITENAVFTFHANGDAWNIECAATGNYWSTLTGAATGTFVPTSEADAGSWTFTFSGNNIALTSGGYYINRSSGVLHGWSATIALQIYTVEVDTESTQWVPSIADNAFLTVGEKVSSISAASDVADNSKWYIVTQVRGGETPMYDAGTGSTLKRAGTSVTAASLNETYAKNNTAYLVRFISAGDGLYNMQFANGDWIDGSLKTTNSKGDAGKYAFYNSNSGSGSYFGWNVSSTSGSIVDNNGAGYTLAFWGSGTVSGTSGNNVWYVYETTVEVPSVTIDVTYVQYVNGVATGVSSTETVLPNSAINVPSSLYNGYSALAYNFSTEGTIGEEDVTIKVNIDAKAGLITDLNQLSNAKAYTLTTARGSLGTNGTQMVSTNGTSYSASNFAIISYEDNYYLYSVADSKFVSNKTQPALTEDISEVSPLTFTLTTAPLYYMGMGSNGVNVSNYDTGIVVNSWTTVDEGNQYCIFEVADFDPTDALAVLEEYFHPSYAVTYVVKDASGNTIFTSDPVGTTLGAQITTLPSDYQLSNFYEYNTVDVTISEQSTTVEFTATLKETPNFKFTADATNPVWYKLKIRDANYPTYVAEGTPNVTLPTTDANDQTVQWAFIGEPYAGFTLINRAAGTDLVLGSATATGDGNEGGNVYATLAAAGTQTYEKFFAYESNLLTNGFFLFNAEGHALNRRDEANLAYWTGGYDVGSTFVAEEVLEANMRISDAEWGTFWAPFAVEIPEGVKAYTGELQDENSWIRMNELTDGYIPANTGVVVNLVDGEPFEKTLSPMNPQPNAAAVTSCYTGNESGAVMNVAVGAYLLQKQDDVVGWYQIQSEGFTLAPNRCYLTVPNSARPFIGMDVVDGGATGINSIATEARTKADGKYMVKGQVVVVKAGKAYNMNGTEIK